MTVILSPAKNMRPCNAYNNLSLPKLIEKSRALLEIIGKYDMWELESILKVNPKIAEDAFIFYKNMKLDNLGSPALLSYNGLAYKHLKAETLSKSDMEFADKHIRILSGFYGVLKPMDSIYPYRLEMQARVGALSLYNFWGSDIFSNMSMPIINLASKEYFKCLSKYANEDDVIHCSFKTYRRGVLKCLPTESKIHRGAMARFIIKNKITDIAEIKHYNYNEYTYEESLSSKNHFVFKGEF